MTILTVAAGYASNTSKLSKDLCLTNSKSSLRQHLISISDILALTIHSLCISILNNEHSYSPTDVTTEFTAYSKKRLENE